MKIDIIQALKQEEDSKLAVAAWDLLEPDTRVIMTRSDPSIVEYVEHCKNVLRTVNDWRFKDE